MTAKPVYNSQSYPTSLGTTLPSAGGCINPIATSIPGES